ncbi:hypothetical protein VDGL01_12045 [Verticillium dahliae]
MRNDIPPFAHLPLQPSYNTKSSEPETSSVGDISGAKQSQDMGWNTANNLKEDVEQARTRLQTLGLVDAKEVFLSSNENWLKKERQSTEKCLETCNQCLAQHDDSQERRSRKRGEPANQRVAPLHTREDLTQAEVEILFSLQKLIENLKSALHDRQTGSQQKSHSGIDGTFHQAKSICGDQLRESARKPLTSDQHLGVLDLAPESEKKLPNNIHVNEDVYIDVGGEQTLITSHNQRFEVRRVRIGTRARQTVIASSEAGLREVLRSRREE